MSAYRCCEQCALTGTATVSREGPMVIGGPQQSTGLPLSVLKPIDGPCPRCGNTLPDGSFEDAWKRISVETVYHPENTKYKAQRLLWVGAQAKRKAVAA